MQEFQWSISVFRRLFKGETSLYDHEVARIQSANLRTQSTLSTSINCENNIFFDKGLLSEYLRYSKRLRG